MVVVSEYENCELCHDRQDRNISPFQPVELGPHHEQPTIRLNKFYF